jgi:AraC family transcriptional regulator
MSSTPERTNYEERLSRVTDHIYGHLDEDIDLSRLAEIACLSPYHWHRIYHALKGETIAATVKRLRLHRAAGFLANTTMTIEEISARSGYSNPESFARAFKETVGLSPAEYRKNGSHTKFSARGPDTASAPGDVVIKTLPPMRAICVEHTGSYMMIGKAFDMLFGRLGAASLLGTQAPRLIGIYYDDPSAVPEAALRARAGVIADTDIAVAPPLEITEVRGGRYAVLRHKGPYADMKAAYQWPYWEWLVQSGAEAADAPVFEEYLNSPRDTAPTELLTDICLPLA